MQRARLILTGYFTGTTLHYLTTGETVMLIYSLIMAVFFGIMSIVDARVNAND